jgi:uncharacterized membrane protein
MVNGYCQVYYITGVVITSFFQNLKDLWLLYTIGAVTTIIILILGLILIDDSKK